MVSVELFRLSWLPGYWVKPISADPRLPALCKLPSDFGPCDGNFPRWFFNSKKGMCEKFLYGGCGGNKNNFKTRQECDKTCWCPPQCDCYCEFGFKHDEYGCELCSCIDPCKVRGDRLNSQCPYISHVLRRTDCLSPLICGKINCSVAPVGGWRCWTSIKCYFVYSGYFPCHNIWQKSTNILTNECIIKHTSVSCKAPCQLYKHNILFKCNTAILHASTWNFCIHDLL